MKDRQQIILKKSDLEYLENRELFGMVNDCGRIANTVDDFSDIPFWWLEELYSDQNWPQLFFYVEKILLGEARVIDRATPIVNSFIQNVRQQREQESFYE
jgi:hypothetical protein